MDTLSLKDTAKAIRERLKELGIKPISVRSHYFANGCSVDVTLLKGVDVDLSGYSYGAFDGMTDSFIYRERIITYQGKQYHPGAKYVTLHSV
jgi:hypothetical protein